MDILSITLDSAHAAGTGAAALVFLLGYLVGFVLFQKWPRIATPTPVAHRHIISGLSAALVAVIVGFGLHAADGATAAAKEQGQGQGQGGPVVVALQAPLPVQVMEDYSVIYPGRDQSGSPSN
jgi:anti-sigma factor RsiW